MKKKYNILIVDDSEYNRDLLRLRLRSMGNSFLAASGPEALEIVKNEVLDLVLLDIMMPGMSGMEVLKIIRESKTLLELPVIMVTAKTDSSDIVKALEDGANDYLIKPIDFKIAKARINMQLELKQLASFREEFMSIASHDLKKPLSMIIDVTEQLMDDIDSEADVTDMKELLYIISRSGHDIKKLVTEFLDLQAVDNGNLTLSEIDTNVAELVDGLVHKHALHASSKDIEINTTLSGELSSLLVDPERLSQVIQNLIDNALKFSPLGTQVNVATSFNDGFLLFESIDQGPGLNGDDMKRVFTKFARLNNKPTGDESSSGLGLAICKKVIDLMDGEVGVKNNENQPGATFWFKIPVKQS